MTAETITTAVASRPPQTLSDLIEERSKDFTTVLPSHIKPETWIRLAQGALRKNAKLQQAAKSNPRSLLVALLDAARQGLEPGTEQYYLVPRKVKGKLEVQGMRGYQGEIELIYRAGACSSVVVEVVREKDTFAWAPGRMERPEHEAKWFEDRGGLIGVYAYAIMKDGSTSKVVVLNQLDIDLAKSKSDGADTEYSPWQWNPASMWLKTAVHRLQKFVPTSAEYIREQLRAVQDVAAEQADSAAARAAARGSTITYTGADDDIQDAELVDEQQPHEHTVDRYDPHCADCVQLLGDQDHVDNHTTAPAPGCRWCDAELAAAEDGA